MPLAKASNQIFVQEIDSSIEARAAFCLRDNYRCGAVRQHSGPGLADLIRLPSEFALAGMAQSVELA